MNKKRVINIAFVLLVISFIILIIPFNNGKNLIQTFMNQYKANANYNKLKVVSVDMIKRTTGAEPFNTSTKKSVDDGSVLSSDEEGWDVSDKDLYVRTFDTFAYDFELEINRNDLTTDAQFSTTGGRIKVEVIVPDNNDYLLNNSYWMKSLSNYNSTTHSYTMYYDMPTDTNPIGAVQRLNFVFQTRGRALVLDDEHKPIFKFWMEGNTESSSDNVEPVTISDSENIIVTGKEALKYSLLSGNINFKSTRDGVSGNYVQFGLKVSLDYPHSGFNTYKGAKVSSDDILSNIDIHYYYRDVDNDNDFTEFTNENEEGQRVLNGIELIAYGPSGDVTPGFVPNENMNIIGTYKTNGYSYRNSGNVLVSLSGQQLKIKNSGYYFTNSSASDYIYIDGIELFLPRRSDDNDANYDYKVTFKGTEISLVDSEEEIIKTFLKNSNITMNFNSKIDGNISYSMYNTGSFGTNDVLFASNDQSKQVYESITLSASSGPFLGGTDTLVVWDSSVAKQYNVSYSRSKYYEKNHTIYYGVYRNNKANGVIGEDNVNAALYEDFDWYTTKSEALENGMLAAIFVDDRAFMGLNMSNTINIYYTAPDNSDLYDVSGIVRRKTRIYIDEERTDFVSIGYGTDYIKGTVSDGKVTTGSPEAVGDTIYYPSYSTQIYANLYNMQGSSTGYFSVNDEKIKVELIPAIDATASSVLDAKDNITMYALIPVKYSYIPNSANYEPDSIYQLSDKQSLLVWKFNNWTIGEDLPKITFLIDISPYLQNNSSATIISQIKGDSEYSKNSYYYYGYKKASGASSDTVYGYYSYSYIYLTNLAGQSIRKTLDKGSINKNESFISNDLVYNISQETLADINTVQEIPKNGDSYGTNYHGTYRIKVNSIADNSKMYYTTTPIADFNLSKDSHDRYLPKDMDFDNDSRWVELNVGDYIPSDATVIGTHYDTLPTTMDISYNVTYETNDNEIGDRYCMQIFGATDNLMNAMASENKCVTVGSRKITGRLWVTTSYTRYYYSSDKVPENKTIILLNEAGNEIARTTVNEEGKYSFEELERGNYYIKYEIPEHYEAIKKYSFSSTNYNHATETGITDIIPLNDLFASDVSKTANVGIRKKKYTLTVHHYLENTETKLADDVTSQYIYNVEYATHKSNDVPSKYEVKSTVGVLSGPITEDTTVIYYYGLKPSRVVVKYIDKDTGGNIELDDVYNKKYDDSYSVSKKTFEHYNYDSMEGEENGVLATDEVVVKYFYTKKPATVVTHHYYDNTTNSICPSVTDDTKHHTESYSTSACTTIPINYELKSIDGDANGTIESDSVIVKYYYQKKNSTLTNTIVKTGDSSLTTYGNKVKYKITVNSVITDYIGDGTLTITDTLPYHINSSTSTLDGGVYNSENKTIIWTISLNGIDSFTSTNNTINIEKNIELDYSDLNPKDRNMINKVNSSIVLDNNTDSKDAQYNTDIAIKGKVTVKYIDQDNNNLEDPISREGLVGDIFTSEEKSFTGYELVSKPDNESVEYKVEDQTLTYKYNLIKYAVTIRTTNDGGTVEGNEIVSYGQDSTEGKLIIRVNDGYVISSITINGEELTFDNSKEIVLDKITNILEDKDIIVSFKQVVKSPDTAKNSIIKPIVFILIIIMFIFVIKKRKELFNYK